MATSPSPLAPALASLRTSVSLLSSSLQILNNGTSDLPRLCKALSQTRHFELLPTSTLSTAQDAVLAELRPEVEALLKKVESVVERRERRVEWLRARWALVEGRLGREVQGRLSSAKTAARPSGGAGGLGKSKWAEDVGIVGGAKAQRMRQKKERLSYAVDRLQMQANQRQRQLRLSMAQQEQRQQDAVEESEVKVPEEDDIEF